MPNTNLKDIFKNGEDFKLKEVDFTSKEVRKSFADLKKQQEKSRSMKDVDWNELDKFQITI